MGPLRRYAGRRPARPRSWAAVLDRYADALVHFGAGFYAWAASGASVLFGPAWSRLTAGAVVLAVTGNHMVSYSSARLVADLGYRYQLEPAQVLFVRDVPRDHELVNGWRAVRGHPAPRREGRVPAPRPPKRAGPGRAHPVVGAGRATRGRVLGGCRSLAPDSEVKGLRNVPARRIAVHSYRCSKGSGFALRTKEKGRRLAGPYRSKSLSNRLLRAGDRYEYRDVVWSGPRPSAESSWPFTRVPQPCD